MQKIKQQNDQLQKGIETLLDQIEKQKETNGQHQSQIETLLKFNERLLEIIENELNNNKKDNASLQPISQRSERQSDLMGAAPTLKSFLKQTKNIAKSQYGGPARSLIQRPSQSISGNKLNIFEKEVMKSEVDHSIDQRQPSMIPQHHQAPTSSVVTPQIKRILEKGKQVKKEMNSQIKTFQNYAEQNNKFFDSKISELRQLNDKLNTFHPLDQFSKITQKVNLSNHTANLVRNAMMKNMI